MAGVFTTVGWPLQRRPRIERKAQVFGTTSAEVEEMIRLRLAELDALPENLKYL